MKSILILETANGLVLMLRTNKLVAHCSLSGAKLHFLHINHHLYCIYLRVELNQVDVSVLAANSAHDRKFRLLRLCVLPEGANALQAHVMIT